MGVGVCVYSLTLPSLYLPVSSFFFALSHQGRTRPKLDADVDLVELASDKFCAGFS